MQYAWLGPWSDPCMQWVYEREGKFPEEYKVGIMGFLLSCRQAYSEGIDVLYSHNCISIQSEPLLQHLPQLIAPHRLASITSLEIVKFRRPQEVTVALTPKGRAQSLNGRPGDPKCGLKSRADLPPPLRAPERWRPLLLWMRH